MMDKTFIEAILKGRPTEILNFKNGTQLVTGPVFWPPLPEEPRVDPIRISTLTGLVDYLENEIDVSQEIPTDKMLFLHVESPFSVKLLSHIRGVHRYRDEFVSAVVEYEDEHIGFKFGQFMPHPKFMIALQALFIDYGDRAKLLRILGTIKDEAIKTSMDDGVTQRVIAAAGVVMQGEVPVPNPVMLQPWRTFHEVPQPPSQFILRINKPTPGRPDLEIALFEADGGMWEREAVLAIKEYLDAKLADLNIPVLA